MDSHGFNRFDGGQLGQNRRHSLGQHCFTGARRADHQHVGTNSTHAPPIGYNAGMRQFSLKRLFVAVTMVAIGTALIAAFLKGQILFGMPELQASMGWIFVLEAIGVLSAMKPLEFAVLAAIGALLGFLMIPAT